MPPNYWGIVEGLQSIIKGHTILLIQHLGRFYILFSSELSNPAAENWEEFKPLFPEETTEDLIKKFLLEHGLVVKDKLKHGETYLGFNTGRQKQHELLFLYDIHTNPEIIVEEVNSLPTSSMKLEFFAYVHMATQE